MREIIDKNYISIFLFSLENKQTKTVYIESSRDGKTITYEKFIIKKCDKIIEQRQVKVCK